jgi:putative ABC transport system substrate-binding protein
MRRREFITLLGGGIAAPWSFAAHAQQPVSRVRRVGLLVGSADNSEGRARVDAFRQALTSFGWTDGRNIQFDVRWAAAQVGDRTQAMANELIGLKPDVLLSEATPATSTLVHENSGIPIVFVNVTDPVGTGFVASLARPGGTVTGFMSNEPSMGGKWLQLLKEMVPALKRAAFMYNPASAGLFVKPFLQSFEAAGHEIDVEPVEVTIAEAADIQKAMTAIGGKPDEGVIVMADIFSTVHQAEYVAFANQYRVPTVYPFGFFATKGGLVGFGALNVDLFRRAGEYVDRILRGEAPASLPVQASTKFELVVNLKTAKMIGVDMPTSILLRADDVIE